MIIFLNLFCFGKILQLIHSICQCFLLHSRNNYKWLLYCLTMQKHNIITSKEIGEKIKKRRRELKLSQEELAEILDVTYQQIQRYENGTNKLNVENIQMVAEALSVPLSYFFDSYASTVITEEKLPHLSSKEKNLLKLFKKIKDSRSKNLVIQLSRLAAK